VPGGDEPLDTQPAHDVATIPFRESSTAASLNTSYDSASPMIVPPRETSRLA
jgi:hypothetical protein